MWLHIPRKHISVSHLESEDLIWRLRLGVLERLIPSVTLKTKLLQPQYWRRGGKTEHWLRHLYGLTLKPSIMEAGAASWMASLRASRANPIASQETKVGNTTQNTFGPLSEMELELPIQHGYFLKTSVESLESEDTKSLETFKNWVTMFRQHSYRRRRSARRIVGADSSFWQTPTASEKHQTARFGDRLGRGPGNYDGDLLTQSEFRGGHYGTADGLDLTPKDRTHLLGNSVVPLQAAVAWRLLWHNYASTRK